MSDEDAAAAIVKDTVDLIRKQTKVVFEESANRRVHKRCSKKTVYS